MDLGEEEGTWVLTRPRTLYAEGTGCGVITLHNLWSCASVGKQTGLYVFHWHILRH